jgi:hypothetical protein
MQRDTHLAPFQFAECNQRGSLIACSVISLLSHKRREMLDSMVR